MYLYKNNGYSYDSKQLIIENFQKILKENKIITTIRKTRGEDILGACGQLKSLSQRPKTNAS